MTSYSINLDTYLSPPIPHSYSSFSLILPGLTCDKIHEIISFYDLVNLKGKKLNLRDFCYNLILNEVDKIHISLRSGDIDET